VSADQSPAAKAAASGRGLFDRLLKNAGIIVDDVVASKTFSVTMARSLGAASSVSSLVRNTTQQVGELAADWLNVPTRHQLIEMAGRLNRIELMLDDIEYRTGELLRRPEQEPGSETEEDSGDLETEADDE
jgi:hypothetical protein